MGSGAICADEQASSLSAQAKREFDTAFAKARDWKADAILVAAMIDYTQKIDPANGTDSFAFYSPSEPQYYWTMTFNQKALSSGSTYSRAIYYKDDYKLPADTVPVAMKYWTNDFVKALQKADEIGGKDFRSKNAVYDINILLSSKKDQYLVWKVGYLVGGQILFSKDIDAYTGEEFKEKTTTQ